MVNIIQFIIAILISLSFQFLFPFSWQPLDTFLYGTRDHGDPGANIIIFTISQWYFSFSVSWLFYHKNPYINNFLIYSIVPLSYIVVYEFLFLHLYYDYIHINPLIIDFYLIGNRKKYLSQKFAPYIISLNMVWLISVYFLKLAYYNEELLIFLRNILIYLSSWIVLSLFFRVKTVDQQDVS